MASFAELTKRVHSINDLILTDMISGKKDYSEESLEFRTRLLTTKNWFCRISCANKKRFVLALIEDLESVWTLSLLLKSIWNCRPKDAMLSISEPRIWSCYDGVPLDHNRTALPLSTLREVMDNDRLWFSSLEPESQSIMLSELLMISGGPILWEVLRHARALYDNYTDQQLKHLQQCNVITEPPAEKVKPPPEPPKKEQGTPRKSSVGNSGADSGRPPAGQALKELDVVLAAWNANIKSMRDRMKLEELEMIFSDGSKKKVWKVNRPKPEVIETVDYIQLLPSTIGKKILMYLPPTQLAECSRVNKYWSYLVDDIRTELTTRQKINIELEKLRDNMLRHDTSLDLLTKPEFQTTATTSMATMTEVSRRTKNQTSGRATSKSCVLSFKQALNKRDANLRFKPIRNMAELHERLDRRGAADENLRKWCETILNQSLEMKIAEKYSRKAEGLILSEDTRFPCPMMKHILSVPLRKPLVKDPAVSEIVHTKVNVSTGLVLETPITRDSKHYNLWCKDLSGLYPVCKIPSYQFPF